VRRRNQRGNAVVEVALMAPWIFFLFLGVFDVGFYCYAAICTQNAARAVALSQAQTSTFDKCTVALWELRTLPNSPPVNGGTCDALPVMVTLTTLNGSACPDAGLGSATTYAGTTFCVQSAVTYQTIPLLPIPGVLTGRMALTRTSMMRILK
jgi:Flp pilus assembly protein TadG